MIVASQITQQQVYRYKHIYIKKKKQNKILFFIIRVKLILKKYSKDMIILVEGLLE